MTMAAYSPNSPDLARSDFYLFDHVKDLLREQSFEAG
jgi:hypothetical protein